MQNLSSNLWNNLSRVKWKIIMSPGMPPTLSIAGQSVFALLMTQVSVTSITFLLYLATSFRHQTTCLSLYNIMTLCIGCVNVASLGTRLNAVWRSKIFWGVNCMLSKSLKLLHLPAALYTWNGSLGDLQFQCYAKCWRQWVCGWGSIYSCAVVTRPTVGEDHWSLGHARFSRELVLAWRQVGAGRSQTSYDWAKLPWRQWTLQAGDATSRDRKQLLMLFIWWESMNLPWRCVLPLLYWECWHQIYWAIPFNKHTPPSEER